jgi:DNA modification methylase
MLNSSEPGELVYEPFCGSGTTMIAAHQLGRTVRAMELDPRYVAVTLERLAALGLKPELRREGLTAEAPGKPEPTAARKGSRDKA